MTNALEVPEAFEPYVVRLVEMAERDPNMRQTFDRLLLVIVAALDRLDGAETAEQASDQ
jgi:hypothetical protein